MGTFGLAQAAGFGLGMFAGAVQLDLARPALGESAAFASVFFTEAVVFLVAAGLALVIPRATAARGPAPQPA